MNEDLPKLDKAKERDELVIRLRDDGMTFTKIGKMLGMSYSRTTQLFGRGMRRRGFTKAWTGRKEEWVKK